MNIQYRTRNFQCPEKKAEQKLKTHVGVILSLGTSEQKREKS